jgi:integrase/recombinase XerD
VDTQIQVAVNSHLAALHVAGASPSTICGRRLLLRRFTGWCADHELHALPRLDTASVGAYQLSLTRSEAGGAALSDGAQRNRLVAVRMFIRWALRAGLISVDPTALLELPRVPRRLPRSVLTSQEAERVLAVPDVSTRAGLRDRAILELLYSSGLRRMELIGLDLSDLDDRRGVLLVRLGKGKKDRFVPVGRRAIEWIRRYLGTSRPALLGQHQSPALFVSRRGTRISRARMNERLRGYVVDARINKPGSCHIWRHTMATLMHERGADLRDLQVLLGHAQISTTAIYTHISTERLQEVHWRTHPANNYRRRRVRPGRAEVNTPPSTTGIPFTITNEIPVAY